MVERIVLVKLNEDALSRRDDMAAVDAYVPHPAHQAYLVQVLNPVAGVKKAWNFTLPG